MLYADNCGFLLDKMDGLLVSLLAGLLVGRLAGCPYGRLGNSIFMDEALSIHVSAALLGLQIFIGSTMCLVCS